MNYLIFVTIVIFLCSVYIWYISMLYKSYKQTQKDMEEMHQVNIETLKQIERAVERVAQKKNQ